MKPMMRKQISLAQELWNLTQMECIQCKADKLVYSAESPEFGPVILKVDSYGDMVEGEALMLSLVNQCRLYAVRTDWGILLEERIIPGTPLRQEQDPEKRIQVFAELFRQIHVTDYRGQEYLRWLEEIVRYCQMYSMGSPLVQMAKKALAICVEMYEKYPTQKLLHGDLHHDNILLRSDGSYCIIDPKSVTGPEILDVPRFLLNELPMEDDWNRHMTWAVERVSRELGYPEVNLRKVFYMETVLANVWNLEDGLPVSREQLAFVESFLAETTPS